MKDSWDDCDVWTQAKIYEFNQICNHDENPPETPAPSSKGKSRGRKR